MARPVIEVNPSRLSDGDLLKIIEEIEHEEEFTIGAHTLVRLQRSRWGEKAWMVYCRHMGGLSTQRYATEEKAREAFARLRGELVTSILTGEPINIAGLLGR